MIRARLAELRTRLRHSVGLREAFLAAGWGLMVGGLWAWLEPGVAVAWGGAIVFVLAVSDRVQRWLA